MAGPPYDLVRMPPGEKAAWMAGYEWGWRHATDASGRTHEQAIEDLTQHYTRIQLLAEEVDRTLATTKHAADDR